MACVLEAVGISSPLTTSRRSSCTSNSVACASVLRGRRSFNRKNLYHLPSCRGLRIEGQDSRGQSVSNNEKKTRGFRSAVCEAQETVAQVKDVNDGTWKSLVLDSEIPVLVDFWAPWCGPCRMIEPLIDELAKQYSGKIRCFKLNTDESPRIATEYGIRSIPTVMLFKNGEKKDTVIGAVPKTTLTASIEKYMEW